MKKVDVIVINWNGCDHLKICLPALREQTLKDFRVILVENGSVDNSAAWVKENHPWVDLVCLDKNAGFTGANIVGYEHSTADYVVLLNNDTRPDPDWLEILVKAAEDHPEVGIVASTMLRWGTEIVDTAGDGCTMAGTGFKASTGLHRSQLYDGYVFGACAGAALYKRKMLDEIGFLDPDYFLNQEDADLSFRAQISGWKVWLASKALVHHRVTATNGKLSAVVVYNGAKNNEMTYWKNMPSGLLLKTLPHRFAQTLFSFINLGIKKKMMIPFLKGKVYALASIPEIVRKRRENMEKVAVSTDYIYSLLSPVFTLDYLLGRRRIRQEYNKSIQATKV